VADVLTAEQKQGLPDVVVRIPAVDALRRNERPAAVEEGQEVRGRLSPLRLEPGHRGRDVPPVHDVLDDAGNPQPFRH
jgi:hypothetical protein